MRDRAGVARVAHNHKVVGSNPTPATNDLVKFMGKISPYFLILAFIIGITAAYLFMMYFYEPANTVTVSRRTNNDLVLLKLSNTGNADVFGPQYWEAFHKLANMIPCSICRNDAIPLEIFKHDIVNLSLGKKVFDKENWKKLVTKVNELDKKSLL